MHPLIPQGELKGGGKMPSDYRSRARQPAEDGPRKIAFEPSGSQADGDDVALTEPPPQAAQQRQDWRPRQD
jgi:hypothetical protein